MDISSGLRKSQKKHRSQREHLRNGLRVFAVFCPHNSLTRQRKPSLIPFAISDPGQQPRFPSYLFIHTGTHILMQLKSFKFLHTHFRVDIFHCNWLANETVQCFVLWFLLPLLPPLRKALKPESSASDSWRLRAGVS